MSADGSQVIASFVAYSGTILYEQVGILYVPQPSLQLQTVLFKRVWGNSNVYHMTT